MESVRHPSPRPRRLLLCLLLTLAVPRVYADFWYEHYDAAKKALRSGEWQEALEQLEMALERRGESGAKVRT